MNTLPDQLAAALACAGGRPENQADVAMMVFSRWLREESGRSASAVSGSDELTVICDTHRYRILKALADEVTRQRLAAEEKPTSSAGG